MNIENNAQKLVQLASSVAAGVRPEICQAFPQLQTASRFEQWDFFAATLAVWTAYSRIGMDVEADLRPTVESIVLGNVEAWNAKGVAAMEDLTQFVVNMSQGETDVERKQTLTPILGGTWVVWNLIEKQPQESEAGLVSAIGELFVIKFGAYWRVEMS